MKSSDLTQKYMEQSVLTMSGSEMIALLYDKALLNITKGIQALNKKDYPQANNTLIKAQDIILYLIDCLNMNYPIAHNLYSLYDFAYRQLVKANIEKDASSLAEVYSMLSEIRAVWKQAVK